MVYAQDSVSGFGALLGSLLGDLQKKPIGSLQPAGAT